MRDNLERKKGGIKNRTLRAIAAVVFVGIIIFCAISIAQNTGRGLRLDITEQKLYTLSEGTRAILGKLRQPIRMKLYYTRTAVMKAPDQIQYFNNYYHFVRSLLDEYVAAANGMIEFEVIDPRPFSDDEADALRFGLRRIPMSEEENFVFGLVAQTQFGVTKTIPLFSPARQNFVEYDISYLIDTSIRRQKKTIGILSSLPVMGDEVSGYMAQMMRMQGQQPRGPWTIVKHMRSKYEVTRVETEVEQIEGVDILIVIHPKNLPEKTLFAVDQFVLNGGRTIVCVDPYCMSDQPPQQMQMMMQQGYQSGSELNKLMENWGLQMPENTFAGDRELALVAALGGAQRPQKIIGLLGVTGRGFNRENVITAELNQVRVLFAGALKQIIADSNETEIKHIPLMSTTDRGNVWSITSPYELMIPDAEALMKKFTDGTEAIHMGYLVTGRFKSGFPEGVAVTDESDPNSKARRLTGLTEADTDCAVAVFSDVDFISDMLAYENSFFGRITVADNATLLFNTLDDLTGSADLISIRSRGNFTRPFTVVDRIEAEAEKGTIEEEKRINAEITSFRGELNSIIASAKKGEEEIVGSSIIQKKKELELKIHEAQVRLREVKMQKRQRIEHLGDSLRNLNTLPGPALILLIAVILGLWRSTKKRHYISHASDA